MDEQEPDRELIPSDEDILPDEAGDAYVAHSTPDIGTDRNRRLRLFVVLPIAVFAIVIAIVILVSR